MADIVLINPRFEISFWGLEHALPFIGKRSLLPVAALPLLAALTPPRHRLTIIDENVEPIDFARCAEADIVGVTGMVVQRVRMREILTELKRLGAFTVSQFGQVKTPSWPAQAVSSQTDRPFATGHRPNRRTRSGCLSA